jgi:hypothetical protein
MNASSQEPTIHVTIGRIEVRAVTERSAPEPPPTRANPTRTLDDYLRERDTGRRDAPGSGRR